MIDRTQGQYELKEPSLYSAFRRLEQSKLIRSFGAMRVRGQAQYYALTPDGKVYYENALNEWNKVKIIIDTILYGKNKEAYMKILNFILKGFSQHRKNS